MTANSPDSQANPKNLQSHIAFIARFRNFEAMRGMQGCYFTHLRAAAHFLQHLTCNDDGTELVRREASEAGESQGVASARSLRAATSWAASPKRLRCERFRRWRADGVLPCRRRAGRDTGSADTTGGRVATARATSRGAAREARGRVGA